MNETTDPTATFASERLLSASPQEIFAAFEDPARLARWWGPAGFTNSFELFEFVVGGRWRFVMHGPNGADYPNENAFRVIEPHTRIVIEHVVPPWFLLTVTLTPRGAQTHLTWRQQFESAEVAAKLQSVVAPSNEQNLDRLEAELARR